MLLTRTGIVRPVPAAGPAWAGDPGPWVRSQGREPPVAAETRGASRSSPHAGGLAAGPSGRLREPAGGRDQPPGELQPPQPRPRQRGCATAGASQRAGHRCDRVGVPADLYREPDRISRLIRVSQERRQRGRDCLQRRHPVADGTTPPGPPACPGCWRRPGPPRRPAPPRRLGPAGAHGSPPRCAAPAQPPGPGRPPPILVNLPAAVGQVPGDSQRQHRVVGDAQQRGGGRHAARSAARTHRWPSNGAPSASPHARPSSAPRTRARRVTSSAMTTATLSARTDRFHGNRGKMPELTAGLDRVKREP